MNLLNGLVSYWKCDETSGTTLTDSVGGYNGTADNSQVFGTNGKINKALDFTKSNNYVEIVGFSTLNAPFTFSTWINPSTSSAQYIVRLRNNAQVSFIRGFSGTSLELYIYSSGGGTQRRQIVSSLSINTWYHIVIIQTSATNWKFYVNGVDINNDLTSQSITNTFDEFVIGRPSAASTTQAYDGLIDEIMIFNRALTANEIKYLYEIQRNGSPLGQYPFNTSGNSFGGGI
jgi:MSHA biogenesis protein MshQ